MNMRWWHRTPAAPGEEDGLEVPPLKIVKKRQQERLSRDYDVAWLAELEVSRPRSSYGIGGSFGRRSGSWSVGKRWSKDVYPSDIEEVAKAVDSSDSLSTIQEVDEKVNRPGAEKRVGRLFDEKTRSRFYSEVEI